MSPRRALVIAGLLDLGVLVTPVSAQEVAPKVHDSARTVHDFLADIAKTVSTDALRDQLASALEDPATLNRAVQLLFRDDAGWRLLRDLNVRFKTFEAESARAALGLSYSYSKDLKRETF